ncbi:darcynin family protein [Myceligenerans indicum]|uniref:Darcynin 1 n=1 Tax=Myceligenerans indicum TaxID=2593663 RepID=A0ABS1LG00_9MICO|nr:darcynin family protein [Myceligenerans indicum]MBL0885166.1 Darcynin 1 [Myceligenerans indicum]
MYVVMNMLQFQPAWLRLERGERARVWEDVQALAARAEGLRLRWFDAEAFCADYSDILFVETEDLSAYYMFWEAVRDTELFSVPYVEVKQVAMGIEDGFVAYDAAVGVHAGASHE